MHIGRKQLGYIVTHLLENCTSDEQSSIIMKLVPHTGINGQGVEANWMCRMLIEIGVGEENIRKALLVGQECIVNERKKATESLFQNLDLKKLLDPEKVSANNNVIKINDIIKIIEESPCNRNDHSPDDLVRTVCLDYGAETDIKVQFNADSNEVMAVYVDGQRVSGDDYKADLVESCPDNETDDTPEP